MTFSNLNRRRCNFHWLLSLFLFSALTFVPSMISVAQAKATTQRNPQAAWVYPIGEPGKPFGDGFSVRHGYATENTWYNPGALHTGEDWYLDDGNTAGAGVYAVADSEIVFAGSEYPGLVVIARHSGGLFSMYGHLDYELAVETGERVSRGQLLGTVLDRTDGRARSHLHFEIRTFQTTLEVNGDAPRYGYSCGYRCPPGPGYWPIDAPEHPSVIGWRNPAHVIASRAFEGSPPANAEVVVASGSSVSAALWSEPSDHAGAERVGDLPLNPGERFQLTSIVAGLEASDETSAESYWLWYQIVVPDAGRVWVQAAIPSSGDTGSDGRPSTVRFDFLPVELVG